MLSGHWGTIFDNTSPFVAIRSLRYNIWSYPSIWYYQVTEVQYLIIPLHLVLSGHWGQWGTIFDHTSPFGTIRSLRYNIWPYLSIWYYQVTEVQYLTIPLHLVLSGHWGTIFVSGHKGTIFDHTSPFGAIRSLRYNIWSIPLHLVLSGHWGTIFDNTSPFGTIRSLRYNIWSYLHLVLSGHWGTIFDPNSPFGTNTRSLRYNIWSFGSIKLRYNIWLYLSIWCYQVTEV